MNSRALLLAAAALSIAGCSSSSGSTGTPAAASTGGATTEAGIPAEAGAGSCTGSPASWLDDGTLECASNLEAIRNTSNGTDSLELVATQLNITTGLSIVIATNTTLGGTYDCAVGGPAIIEITYRDPAVNSTTVASCSVTLDLTTPDASVVYASGTFSAVLTTPDGGTKNLTDGKFGAAVMNE
jgi:hypothetical protein